MRTGIMLPNLGQSQAAFFAISYANTLIASKSYSDFSLFICDTVAPVAKPLCIVTSIDRIHGFDGLLIATNLYLASLLVNVTTQRKVLYLWDLEWLRDEHQGNYLENLKILQNPELILVARSESHAAVIENYCNRKVDAVVPNFNLKTLTDKYAQVAR